MVEYNKYVPILKWKQGEYQALSKLSDEVKRHVMPLIEIPPVGYDHEMGENSKTINEHIANIGSRLKKKWGVAPCFVDFSQLNLNHIQNCQNYVSIIFELYRNEDCSVIPVIDLDCSNIVLEEIKKVIAIDKNGLCLRIKGKYAGSENINDKINNFIEKLNLSKSEIDLLIDFATLPDSGYINLLINWIKTIKHINMWRSFIISGSSYPKEQIKNQKIYKRMEWILYNECYKVFIESHRLPSFSDYGIGRPEHLGLDMRVIKPYAKMKYTLDDNWYINVGAPVRGPKSRGFAQYKELCQELCSQKFYRGKDFSIGDEYIHNCANENEKTGNLSTWVFVSTNQHITKVVDDLANLYGFSV